MDTRTGQIYPSKDAGMKDLIAKGVAKADAERRLVTGPLPSLRKLRKRIHKQMRREAEK